MKTHALIMRNRLSITHFFVWYSHRHRYTVLNPNGGSNVHRLKNVTRKQTLSESYFVRSVARFVPITFVYHLIFTGYRHITLRSNTGDAIPNCTLFVHVAITNKRGGGVSHFNLALSFISVVEPL